MQFTKGLFLLLIKRVQLALKTDELITAQFDACIDGYLNNHWMLAMESP